MLDPIGYRWRKQQKKGTLSHIPVELADIRAATQSGSYSDVDDNYDHVYDTPIGKTSLCLCAVCMCMDMTK